MIIPIVITVLFVFTSFPALAKTSDRYFAQKEESLFIILLSKFLDCLPRLIIISAVVVNEVVRGSCTK